MPPQRMEPIGWLFFILMAALIGIGVGVLLGFSKGTNEAIQAMRQEAVEHDAGHWVITKDGEPVWKWGPVPKAEEEK